MPIEIVINILKDFKRYVNFLNNNGYDELIVSIKENYDSLIITMRGHMGETYELKVYISNNTGELCVRSIYGDDVIDMTCSEYNVSEKEKNYILFGK